MKKTALILLSALTVTGLGYAFAAHAESTKSPSNKDLMPPVTAQSAAQPSESLENETHPVLNLTPDRSELVRLDREAGSVVVGNPNHVTVMLDSPRLAVVIPRTPGATYFTVLGKDGNVIMQRHVVVAAPKKNYVRVRRSCSNAANNADCQPTSVYFCPDMCHEIGAAAADGESTTLPTTAQ